MASTRSKPYGPRRSLRRRPLRRTSLHTPRISPLTIFLSALLTMPRQTFRDVSPPEARPSTRLGFFRAATPMFGRSSTPSSTRPASSMMQRGAEGKRRSLLSLLTRKRKRKEPGEIPRDPVRLNFLFVGSKAAGQTSLLL